MPWFKVDDGLASKLETTRIPRAQRTAALGLWALAGSWSAHELTDGFIPEHMIDELAGTPESAAWLVSAGYWAEAEGGFQFVVWEGEQPTREKVLEQRRKNNAKVQNWRNRNSTQGTDSVGARVGNPVTNSERDEVANPAPDPTRPDPSSDEENTHFDRAWVNWPKKVEKKKSRIAFARAAKSRDAELLANDIVRFGNAYAATTETKFVPALCVWLAGERWDDVLPTASTPVRVLPAAPTDAEWNAMLSPSMPSGTRIPPTLAELNAGNCRTHAGYPLPCDRCAQRAAS